MFVQQCSFKEELVVIWNQVCLPRQPAVADDVLRSVFNVLQNTHTRTITREHTEHTEHTYSHNYSRTHRTHTRTITRVLTKEGRKDKHFNISQRAILTTTVSSSTPQQVFKLLLIAHWNYQMVTLKNTLADVNIDCEPVAWLQTPIVNTVWVRDNC